MSDTRTNAGVDNFSTSRKLFTWSVSGARSSTIMTAGNLVTTRAMVTLLQERSEATEDRNPGILSQRSVFQVARHVGAALNEVIAFSSPRTQRLLAILAALRVSLVGKSKAGSHPFS